MFQIRYLLDRFIVLSVSFCYVCNIFNKTYSYEKEKDKTRQKKVLYGELGSFCIDFAKYMATGVVITTLLKDLEGHNALIYSGGFVLVSGFLFLGLLFIKLKED